MLNPSVYFFFPHPAATERLREREREREVVAYGGANMTRHEGGGAAYDRVRR
jgi:hypothetical protein